MTNPKITKEPNAKTRPIVSEGTRAKLSIALSGERNPMYGKHLSEERRYKSGWNRGEHLTEEHKVAVIWEEELSNEERLVKIFKRKFI